jgi:dUTP pyrophosphatase
MKIPEGNYGRIAPRSGLALNHMIHVGGGVIDNDYRGEVCVILFNLGTIDFNINKHDRIA